MMSLSFTVGWEKKCKEFLNIKSIGRKSIGRKVEHFSLPAYKFVTITVVGGTLLIDLGRYYNSEKDGAPKGEDVLIDGETSLKNKIIEFFYNNFKIDELC